MDGPEVWHLLALKCWQTLGCHFPCVLSELPAVLWVCVPFSPLTKGDLCEGAGVEEQPLGTHSPCWTGVGAVGHAVRGLWCVWGWVLYFIPC